MNILKIGKVSITIFIIIIAFQSNLCAQSRIIFSRNSGGLNTGGALDLMIYDVKSKKTKLLLKGTVNRRGEYNATTSPNNAKIIFNTYRYSGWKLGIADFKNDKISNVIRLTDRPNYEYNAIFAPNGEQMVYQEFNWNTDDAELFIADKYGKNSKQFTNYKSDTRTPCWTMNGKHIVFTSKQGWNYDILIKAGKAKNLTDGWSAAFAPSTSKVENKIAFLSDKGGSVNLYVMNIDGSDIKNLTSNLKSDNFKLDRFGRSGAWAYKTSWSPNGKQIVFNLMYKGNLELFIIDKDGSNLMQITTNKGTDVTPFWMN